MKRHLRFLLTFFSICFGFITAKAQTYTCTWVGGASGSWENTSNWNISGGVGTGFSYPANTLNNDIVAINNNATITIDSALPQGQVYSIVIGNGATVTIKFNGATTMGVTNAITVGTATTATVLNFTGTGSITGASVISISTGGTLTTVSTVPITAGPSGGGIAMNLNGIATLNGKLTLNGQLNINTTANAVLTTNAAGNTITSGGVQVHSGNTLAWYGTGTTTISGGSSQLYVSSSTNAAKLTIGAGNTVNFAVGSNLTISSSSPYSTYLYNYGTLNFTNSSINTQGVTAAVTAITNYTTGIITLTQTTGTAQIALASYIEFDNYGTVNATASSSITTTNNCNITSYAGANINLTGATITMNANGLLFNTGTITAINSGATASTINLTGNPATLTNYGAIAMTSSYITAGGAAPVITNYGSITGTSSTNTLTGNNLNFSNYGTITMQTTSTLAFTGSTQSFSNAYSNATYPGIINLTTTSALNIQCNSLTFPNSGTINATASTLSLSGTSDLLNNTGTVNLNAGSTLSVSNNTCVVTNTNAFNVTSATVTYTTNAGGSSFVNTNPGICTVTSPSTASVFNFQAGTASYLSNTGTFNATGTTFNFTGGPGYISNTTTNGNFTVSASTINLTANSTAITNGTSGTFTASGGSSIIATGAPSTITNSGTFYAGKSNSPCVVTFNQASSGITNSGFFYVGSTSIITLGGGNQSFATNAGYFTFQSDQYGSGSIGQITNTGSLGFNGSPFYVERFITGGSGYRSYRIFSSPININSSISGTGNITLNYLNVQPTNELNTYAALTGGPLASNGFSVTNPAGNPTIYLYNEALPTSHTSFTKGKTMGVTVIGATTVSTLSNGVTTANVSIPVGNGFYFYFIGDNHLTTTASTRVPENTIITASGTPNQQTVAVKILSTGTTSLSFLSAVTPGYNMVGNPYASTIDLNKVYSDNYNSSTNAISSSFYELYDKTPNQNFVSYDGSSGATSDPTKSARYIVSGQGFFVKATSGSQTITFKEDQKVYNNSLTPTSSPPLLLVAKSNSGDVLTGLHLKVDNGGETYDACGIYFSKTGSDKFDGSDAFDLDGVSPTIYLSSYTADSVRTGINYLADYKKSKIKKIKLYVKGSTDGLYNMTLTDIANIDTTLYNVFLLDHFAKDSLDMRRYKTYAFRINNADTTSFGANRFELALERVPLPPYKLLSFTAQKVNGGVQLTWKTSNEGNYTGFAIQKQDGSNTQYAALYNVQGDGNGNYSYIDHSPSTGNNTYRLLQNDIDDDLLYTNTLNVMYNASAGSGALSVYPNPAKQIITVNFNSSNPLTSSAYEAIIYNSTGLEVLKKSVSSNSWSQDVSSLKPGAYVIEMKNSGGTLLGNSKFVKIQ
ncbi:T9SS type A sorting domain-containing protein [Mucilaginibacter sp.]|uniref:T9SS type A sorting domain-containing protein n=1 Tax=Mucilaginibacter sp. TaxID=1882438 RepID=UPI003D122BD3